MAGKVSQFPGYSVRFHRSMKIWGMAGNILHGMFQPSHLDKVLFVKGVRESRRFPDREIVDIDFTFNKDMTPVKFSVITGIVYEDKWIDSTGAKGTIVAGGINKDFLTFNIKGQTCASFARGCDSNLVILGR
jgi:hypothetical protein